MKQNDEVVLEVFYSLDNKESQYVLNMVWKLATETPNIRIREIEYESIEGRELAFNYNVFLLPTIIINRKKKITGIPTEDELIKEINKQRKQHAS